MFIVPGQQTRTCDGWTRRDWLRVGGLAGISTAALDLPQFLAARESSRALSGGPGYGRAKSCILIFLFGAPAHQDTWDLKPQAPAEVRGEFRPIATNVPGLQFCEHLPRTAQVADRLALIRSVTHPDNTHTVAMHYMLTGVRHRRPTTNPQNAPDDFPCFGAVMHHLRQRQPSSSGLPPAISLNSPANQVSANNHIFPGFFAGFLGAGSDPMFVSQAAQRPDFRAWPPGESPQRLVDRQQLRSRFEAGLQTLERAQPVSNMSSFHEQAFRLLASPAAREAFEIGRETTTLRERYGMTPFGQGCLLARRLVEAGVSLVTVNWERDDAYWDTHANNFKLHRDPLLPNFDRGFTALLEDLSARGLLDETLVVVLSEFGRTPKINAQAGRDHWAPCNTVVLAGGGVSGGAVYGASDRQAAYPAIDPVTPEDLAATIYHLLGVDPRMVLKTPQGQPQTLSHGEPIRRLFL